MSISVYEIQAHNEVPGDINSPNVMFDFATAPKYIVAIACQDANGNGANDPVELEVDIVAQDRLEFTDNQNSQ